MHLGSHRVMTWCTTLSIDVVAGSVCRHMFPYPSALQVLTQQVGVAPEKSRVSKVGVCERARRVGFWIEGKYNGTEGSAVAILFVRSRESCESTHILRPLPFIFEQPHAWSRWPVDPSKSLHTDGS